jgi:tetratricopeptide (TPR) repeat protein
VATEAKIAFLGTGGQKPRLAMTTVSPVNLEPVNIAEFPPGNSVYALAVSPDGHRLAAATRKGQIRAYGLSDFRAAPNDKPILEVFHCPGVTSLAFCTPDLLASGGIDGHIRIWCVSEGKRVADLEAHTGAVLSMCRIGSLLLATLGADAKLCIWDLNSLEQVFCRAELDMPRIGALTCLQYDPSTGSLMHPSRKGELHIYDVRKECELRIVAAHQGDFCAIACNGLHVATAGADDGVLKIWSRSLEQVEFQSPAGSGVVSLGWAGDRAIVTIDRAGNGRVWNLDDRLGSSAPLSGTDFRACKGLPVEIISCQRSAAARRWHEATVEEARSLLTRTDTESTRRLGLIVKELNDCGYTTEAELVRAEAARAQGQPLEELAALLSLTKSLGTQSSAVPALYGLGDVLSRLREPALAVDAFRKALSIEPDYQDTKNRLEILQQEMDAGEGAEHVVRGDLAGFELAVQELRKCTLLQRRFASPIVLETRQPVRIEARVEARILVEALADQLRRSLPDQQHVDLRTVRVLLNGDFRDAEWVYVGSTNLAAAFGLELRRTGDGCELTPYTLFDASGLQIKDSITEKEHNDAVEGALRAVFRTRCADAWLSEVDRIVVAVLHHVRARAISQAIDGMF